MDNEIPKHLKRAGKRPWVVHYHYNKDRSILNYWQQMCTYDRKERFVTEKAAEQSITTFKNKRPGWRPNEPDNWDTKLTYEP